MRTVLCVCAILTLCFFGSPALADEPAKKATTARELQLDFPKDYNFFFTLTIDAWFMDDNGKDSSASTGRITACGVSGEEVCKKVHDILKEACWDVEMVGKTGLVVKGIYLNEKREGEPRKMREWKSLIENYQPLPQGFTSPNWTVVDMPEKQKKK